MVACIPDVYISMVIGDLTIEDLSKEEVSCLREWVRSIDPEAFERGGPPLDKFSEKKACLPDEFISLVIGGYGLNLEDLNREEVSCAREWVVEISFLPYEDRGPQHYVDAMLRACIPDVIISAIIAEEGFYLSDLSREELSCLRRWLADIDPAIFADDASPTEVRAAENEMFSCTPRVFNP